MIACDNCGKQLKNEKVQTKEEGTLGTTYHSFCNKNCLVTYYHQSQKPKNEFWKFKKNNTKQNEPAIGGEVTPGELGKPLV